MKNITWICAIIGLTLLFSSCLKDGNDNQTIVLFGEEEYVKNFYEVIGLYPNDTTLQKYIPIDDTHTATPDVRGEYRFASCELVYSGSLYASPYDTIYFRFGGDFDAWDDYIHGQHHIITHCDIAIPGLYMDPAVFHTDTAYVKGQGNGFCAYFERHVELSQPIGSSSVIKYRLDQGIVITGAKDPANGQILGAKLALYNKDVRVLNPYENPEAAAGIESMKGQLHVFKDSDGFSEMNPDKEHPFLNWNE